MLRSIGIPKSLMRNILLALTCSIGFMTIIKMSCIHTTHNADDKFYLIDDLWKNDKDLDPSTCLRVKIELLNSFKPQLSSLLQKTIKLLNHHNINHTLIAGSLLGSIKMNDIIPWDHDVDLLISSDLPDVYLNHNHCESCAKFQVSYGYPFKSLHVDLHSLSSLNWVSHGLTVDDFHNMSATSFLNQSCYRINRYQDLLKHRYGDWLENKSTCSSSSVRFDGTLWFY